jgi:hypothetical protein
MADTDKAPETTGAAPATPIPPKRSPGHRGADVKDTVAEMAAKAHEISLEAGSKMAAAMKDVVNAAAGLSGFVLESARDLVQYMVRRGQMTQEEADKLIREVEAFQPKRKAHAPPAPPPRPAEKKVAAVHAPHAASPAAMRPLARSAPAKKPAAARTVKKPVAKSSPRKAPARPARKPAAKKLPTRKAHSKPQARSAKAKRR